MDHHPDTGREAREGRGATILTLGILSLVFWGCSPVGLVLGWLAVAKAKHDLPLIESGRIRADERSLTKAGQVCGVIGLCLSGVSLLLQGVYVLMALLVFAGALAAP